MATSKDFRYGGRVALQEQKEMFDVLVSAITDIGYWRWWDEHLPESIQLEFGGVQIFDPPKDETKPPSSLLAIRCVSPSLVSFLTRKGSTNLPNDWPQKLRQDQLEPFHFSHEGPFVLGNGVALDSVLGEVESTIKHFTTESKDSVIKMAFFAGPAGVLIEAKSIRLFLMTGEISLQQAVDMHKAWWTYWKDYWKRRETDKAYPHDPLCEVTIPAG